MVLTDRDLLKRNQEETIFSPFVGEKVRDSVISFGLSSAGYDIRLGHEFKKLSQWKILKAWTRSGFKKVVVDPKGDNSHLYREFTSRDRVVLGSGESILGRSLEWIGMPDDCIAVVLGKSTYARYDIVVYITPAEPGWRGYLTIEIHNAGKAPVYLYPGEGIAQFVFLEGRGSVETPYADNGKYQDQPATPVLGRVE